MLEEYVRRWDFPKDDVFLHDGGNAYKANGAHLFDVLGFQTHVEYPTEVHHWLWPNDNNLHGCKDKWKVDYPDFDDDPEAPLSLMALIDCDADANARYYVLRVTKAGVRRVMRS